MASPRLTDEDLLATVAFQRRQADGWEEGFSLRSDRERALNYAKGEMNDLPTADNRSQAVSMDIADAIETLLPDLMEIFQGGDDVCTFLPNSANDEQQAQQETDYVRHVIEQQNDGYLIHYSLFKDALLTKTGVCKFAWETKALDDETFEGLSLQEMIVAAKDGTLTSVKVNGQPLDLEGLSAALQAGQTDLASILASLPQDGLYDFTIKNEQPGGQVKIWPVPPEDFTVARDTVRLPDATYCGFRTRPRAYELKERGIDPDIVDDLPAYGVLSDQTMQQARDTAGEHLEALVIVGDHDLRQVEVLEHYLRIDADGEGVKIWRVLTGGSDTVLIEKEVVDAIPFAAVTPFVVTHRFYGQSVADKLIEIQRERTALKRTLFDSAYFALNQRTQLVMSKANEWTIQDLLRNEPGVPIRVRDDGAVVPIQAGTLNFDVLQALEFTATESEQRTGIVRNAQGLNPDTLHDTAQGAMALIAAAQKRVRLIARTFAETGLKDLYLGVHALLRKHAENVPVTKLRGQWVPVDPTRWAERSQMTIEIGLGSAGKVQEIATLNGLVQIMERLVQLQQGVNGPIVYAPNVYNLLKKLTEKSGEKNPDAFWTDPRTQPPQQPQPDPQAQAQQAQAQVEQQKAQVDAQRLQLEQQKAQVDAQVKAAQIGADKQERDARHALEAEKLNRDDQFRYAQLAQQREIEMAKIQAGFGQAVTVQHMKDVNDAQQREADVAIQASEAADAARMDRDE